ncbi:MAG: PD-(D/E)XK nuclease superfamily protein [Thermaceae bacterium]
MRPEEVFKARVADALRQLLKECSLPYEVWTEYPSPHGSVIRGQGRRVDVAVLQGGKPFLFVECKWQDSSGSAQDKVFRALEEAKRDRLLGVHSVIVLGGEGWSRELEQWAMGEGMIREEWLGMWIKRFFCQKKRSLRKVSQP